jgi:phage shock protein C
VKALIHPPLEGGTMSIAHELEQLDELHRRGVLTDDEFRRAKARTLGTGPMPTGVSAINNLRRSRDDRWLGGVCGGLALSTGLAAWAWRAGFTLLLLCAGTGVLLYGLLWLLLPVEDPPAMTGAGTRYLTS